MICFTSGTGTDPVRLVRSCASTGLTVAVGILWKWWRHQMETFSALLVICAGNSPVPVKSPHKGQWRGTLMFSLICVWINGRGNNREAGDLRRHSGHYDAIIMFEVFYVYQWFRIYFVWSDIIVQKDQRNRPRLFVTCCIFTRIYWSIIGLCYGVIPPCNTLHTI